MHANIVSISATSNYRELILADLGQLDEMGHKVTHYTTLHFTYSILEGVLALALVLTEF